MAQKAIEEQLGVTEKDIEEIKKEIMRLPALEKTMEGISREMREGNKEMNTMFNQLLEGKTKGVTLSTVTKISTGKRKHQVEDSEDDTGDPEDEMQEGESSPIMRDDGRGERIKLKKLEMPVFNGTDPDGWLFRAELYFQMHRLQRKKNLPCLW